MHACDKGNIIDTEEHIKIIKSNYFYDYINMFFKQNAP